MNPSWHNFTPRPSLAQLYRVLARNPLPHNYHNWQDRNTLLWEVRLVTALITSRNWSKWSSYLNWPHPNGPAINHLLKAKQEPWLLYCFQAYCISSIRCCTAIFFSVCFFSVVTIWGRHLPYCRTGFNCENLIASFSRVHKLWIHKLIILIAHHYVQFVQTQLFNLQCS